ncbi:unnamed protein product [Caenorhabditis sp. 36 PRJEB53466]|nr:unnamed protein product [Caenorhabditis sp. 36 PRJEB53466]
MPDTGYDRADGTSSEEEESDGEVVVATRRKSFGIRVAQSPQQAQQQVLSQIGNLANQRQANEVVVQQTEQHEKTEAEKRALEQHQKLLEAQQIAKAQQAAALQAAAARVAQAQGQAQAQPQSIDQAKAQQEAALRAAQEQAKKAQQEALARAQAAQQEAVARAKAAQEAQQKAQQEALARAQEAQKKAQAEAAEKAKAQADAQKKALEDAQARAAQAQQAALQKAQQAQAQAQAQALQKAQQAQQAQAQAQAQALQKAQQAQQQAQAQTQQAALQKAQQAQAQAQAQAQQKAQQAQAQAQAQAQQKAQQAQAQAQAQAKAQAQQRPQAQPQQVQNAPKAVQQVQNGPGTQKVTGAPAQNQQKAAPQKADLTGAPQKGALAQVQPAQQEIQAAAGPKWSRTPGKVQTQGPQPEQAKQVTAVAPPQGKTALRQTAQVQEQELANEKGNVMSSVVARKPQIQADHLVERFVEKPEEQREKLAVQKGQQLEGAKRWVTDSQLREQPNDMQGQVERGPKATILQDDACWQTQRRVPVEIQQPQVGKIQIPELSEKEIQRTIVAQPASYHKVAWNEFPEEAKLELSAAPKTKTQDWVPVNNEQNELQRSIYKPARMSAVWPPPQDELVKEGQAPLVVKANEDTAWIQQDQNGVLKQAVWGKTSRINRVWPPPENESALSDFGPQHMPVVQWPPPESEIHEREQIEVLQKHIPTKKMERQWPPPPPQYQVVESNGEIETRYNPAEVIEQQADGQQQQQVIRTVIRSQ